MHCWGFGYCCGYRGIEKMIIEIDMDKEMREEIQKAIKKEMEVGGLMRFIRRTIGDVIQTKLQNKINDYKNTMCSFNGRLEGLKRSVDKLENKGDNKNE